jgi:hypothetical protein
MSRGLSYGPATREAGPKSKREHDRIWDVTRWEHEVAGGPIFPRPVADRRIAELNDLGPAQKVARKLASAGLRLR